MPYSIAPPLPMGQTPDGTPVELYTLMNRHGMRMRMMTYGAVVLSLEVPNRMGDFADVLLGHHTLEAYLRDPSFHGTIAGRFANRIARGFFTLDGKSYRLALNDAPAGMPCSLHGGWKGFDKAVWKVRTIIRAEEQGLRFQHTSPDGDEGYPGTLHAQVTYWLTDANEWRIEYELTADKTTPVNLTQHAAFNLKGEGRGDILDHELMLKASRFTPVTAGLIPTGELRAVAGTPMDFTTPHLIGARIAAEDEQLQFGHGYDHNWVLDHPPGELGLAARVYEPTSGRILEVLTTEPGIQFYSGNFLNGQHRGKAGRPYERRHGFCLETQHFPDSPNQPDFPSTLLRPGEVRRSTTIYRFTQD